jgi:CubicO group peptidase (beta-lactamase class C family)
MLAGSTTCHAQSSAPGPGDAAELGTFLDGLHAGLGATHHVAGMAVAVVRDGRVLLLRGYGYADIEHRRAVDPRKTLFRIGAISATLTWLAVMQSVAEGRLDLNAPIDQSLPEELQVLSPWRVQPTLKDLMSHTAGYDDMPIIGLLRHAPYRGTLSDALAEQPALLVRKPGELVSYSNYGAALAGYLVERSSGMSWEQYVEQRILRPLGVAGLTVRQPVPDDLGADLATGYQWRDGRLSPQGFEYIPLAPSGGASASAEAMASYMNCLLNYTQGPTERLLPEWAGHEIFEPHYRGAPRLGAWLHGFYELRPAGPRVYGHDGATRWFHALMALLPESRTGIFIAVNTDAGAAVPKRVYKAFLDRYYPRAMASVPAQWNGAGKRARAVEGWYLSTRLPRRSPARILALGACFHVRRDGASGVVASGPGLPDPLHYVELEPWVYRDPYGEDLLVFRLGKDGQPDVAFVSTDPAAAYGRTAAWINPWLQFGIAGYGVVTILIALVAYPVVVLRGHFSPPAVDRRVRGAQLMAWLACLAYTVCLAALAVYCGNPSEALFGLPPALVMMEWSARAGAVLTVLAAAFSAILWARRIGQTGMRVAYTLVVCGEVTLALWMARWNLFG